MKNSQQCLEGFKKNKTDIMRRFKTVRLGFTITQQAKGILFIDYVKNGKTVI